MEPTLIKVEEERLFHRITVRIAYFDEFSLVCALIFACYVIERAENLEVKLWDSYVEEQMWNEIFMQNVSFSVLYKDDNARDNFLKLVS